MPAELSPSEIEALERRDKSNIVYLRRGVTELKRIVKGYNGGTGLVGHAEQTSKDVRILKQGQTDIKKLLVGDETDINDTGGVKGKIRELSIMQQVVKRIMWLGISSIIAGSAGIIFTLIRTWMLQAVP